MQRLLAAWRGGALLVLTVDLAVEIVVALVVAVEGLVARILGATVVLVGAVGEAVGVVVERIVAVADLHQAGWGREAVEVEAVGVAVAVVVEVVAARELGALSGARAVGVVRARRRRVADLPVLCAVAAAEPDEAAGAVRERRAGHEGARLPLAGRHGGGLAGVVRLAPLHPVEQVRRIVDRRRQVQPGLACRGIRIAKRVAHEDMAVEVLAGAGLHQQEGPGTDGRALGERVAAAVHAQQPARDVPGGRRDVLQLDDVGPGAGVEVEFVDDEFGLGADTHGLRHAVGVVAVGAAVAVFVEQVVAQELDAVVGAFALFGVVTVGEPVEVVVDVVAAVERLDAVVLAQAGLRLLAVGEAIAVVVDAVGAVADLDTGRVTRACVGVRAVGEPVEIVVDTVVAVQRLIACRGIATVVAVLAVGEPVAVVVQIVVALAQLDAGGRPGAELVRAVGAAVDVVVDAVAADLAEALQRALAVFVEAVGGAVAVVVDGITAVAELYIVAVAGAQRAEGPVGGGVSDAVVQEGVDAGDVAGRIDERARLPLAGLDGLGLSRLVGVPPADVVAVVRGVGRAAGRQHQLATGGAEVEARAVDVPLQRVARRGVHLQDRAGCELASVGEEELGACVELDAPAGERRRVAAKVGDLDQVPVGAVDDHLVEHDSRRALTERAAVAVLAVEVAVAVVIHRVAAAGLAALAWRAAVGVARAHGRVDVDVPRRGVLGRAPVAGERVACLQGRAEHRRADLPLVRRRRCGLRRRVAVAPADIAEHAAPLGGIDRRQHELAGRQLQIDPAAEVHVAERVGADPRVHGEIRVGEDPRVRQRLTPAAVADVHPLQRRQASSRVRQLDERVAPLDDHHLGHLRARRAGRLGSAVVVEAVGGAVEVVVDVVVTDLRLRDSAQQAAVAVEAVGLQVEVIVLAVRAGDLQAW